MASVIFLGLGSRLVMRISALLDPAAEGFITDNGNVVGEITLAGSLALLGFVGLIGGLAIGIVWVVIRDWLPLDAGWRIPVAGMVAASTGSFFVVSSENRDFVFLDPASANVAMFVLLVGLTGSATAAFDRLMEDRLPTNRKASGVYLGLASVGAVLGAPSLIFTFFGSGAFAQLSGIFLALAAAATVMNWIRSYSLTGFDGGLQPERLRMLGLASVAGATAFGALHLAIEIDSILASA